MRYCKGAWSSCLSVNAGCHTVSLQLSPFSYSLGCILEKELWRKGNAITFCNAVPCCSVPVSHTYVCCSLHVYFHQGFCYQYSIIDFLLHKRTWYAVICSSFCFPFVCWLCFHLSCAIIKSMSWANYHKWSFSNFLLISRLFLVLLD